MELTKQLEMLKELCALDGVSGCEERVAEYLRAHLPQRREVYVYRSLAELAAARQAQPRHAAARQQRPHEYDRRAHFQHQRMRYRALGKRR